MDMRNVEIMNKLVALQNIRNSDIAFDTPVSYAIAYNIHTLTEASKPYIEERKPLEEKYMQIGEDGRVVHEDMAGMARDESIKQLDEITLNVGIRKVKLSELSASIPVKYMDALFFMIEE